MLEAKSKYYEDVIVGKKQTGKSSKHLILVYFDY